MWRRRIWRRAIRRRRKRMCLDRSRWLRGTSRRRSCCWRSRGGRRGRKSRGAKAPTLSEFVVSGLKPGPISEASAKATAEVGERAKANAGVLRYAQDDGMFWVVLDQTEALREGASMSAIAGLNQGAAEMQHRIERFQTVRDGILAQVRQVIVGQDDVLDQILIALFVGGHCLITGMPGTAKTLMVRTIAQTLGLSFKRIQFTPDLMPSDITGTDIIEEDITTGHRKWTFVEGPLFGNVVLADEINRTPPKTQAAMLEAMQERSCTVRGHNYRLPAPFFVLATQNPIELEGTYPLPEAQLDRFLFNAVLDYLSASDELKVVDLTTANKDPQIAAVTNAEELLEFQQLVRMVPIGESIAKYVVNLVRATRHKSENAPDFVKKYVNYGGSIRAAQFIVLGAKARALSRKRYHVTYDDITALTIPVLRHRILLNFHAESERIDADEILTRLIAHVPPPKEG